ncbi:YHYH protein, partial [Acinetobacter baumannii]
MRGIAPGVAINGVPFDPGTAELWNNDMRWHYEALSGLIPTQGGLGVDANNAHVQPNGAYHYHGLPMGLLNQLNYTTHMTLVGWAADGYP